MISTIIPVRRSQDSTIACIDSVVDSQIGDYEIVVIDDDADFDVAGVVKVYQDNGIKISVYRFGWNVGYVQAVRSGFLNASGDICVMISNDMIVNRNYYHAVINGLKSHDIVRGTSNIVDGYDGRFNLSYFISGTEINRNSIARFAEFVYSVYGYKTEEIDYLIGDAFAIRRVTWMKLDGFDSDYKQYFGDIDFGIRARNAGMTIGCAMGAWLYHSGAGSHTDVSITDRLKDVQIDYNHFRKQFPELPEKYEGLDSMRFEELRYGR